MKLENSILKEVRASVGLDEESTDFDTELLMHINSAIGKLNQNGVGMITVVEDETKTWRDLQDPTQVEGNMYFQMIPWFIMVSTKVIFDPPPPSMVDHYSKSIDETLWRLKTAFETPLPPKPTVIVD